MEDDVLVGGGSDGGIDAIALLVNGRLVSTEEGLQFFFDSHGRLDVEFVLVQAKTSALTLTGTPSALTSNAETGGSLS